YLPNEARMACGEDLILGPLQPGSIVQVSSSKLMLVLYARIAALVLCAAIAGLWLGLRRRAVRRRAA
ncbi:MAG TPA: hypothetical protein VFE73_05585, partial [Reyranella sp.]|nr:hypothetical protein [Reyranella sp.]